MENKGTGGMSIFKTSDFFLLYGEIQSGKASALQTLAIQSLMMGITPIIVLRNFTADSLQMKDGFCKLSDAFVETVCPDSEGIEILVCKHELIQKNKQVYIDALTGKNPKILVAMANATQIASLNELIEELDTPAYFPLIDEIDDLCYNSNAGGEDKQIYDAIETLMEKGVSRGGTTATPITTFFEEKRLKPDQVFIMNRPNDYRGFECITPGIDMRLGENKDLEWLPKTVTSLGKPPLEAKTSNGVQFEKDPEMKPYFRLLTTLPPYARNLYKPSKDTKNTTLPEQAPHPINVLHKTSNFTAHHNEAFDWITSDPGTEKVWSAFVFNGGSNRVYCPQLVGKETPPCSTWKGTITSGHFEVTDTTSVREIYTILLNAGATHIVCFSGKCANRGVNFTDLDYTISLTHERAMFSKTANTSTLLQSLRLLGRCPTYNKHIPLQLSTHEKSYREMCKTYHLTTDMINAAQEEAFLTSMRNLPSFPTFLSEAKFASSKIPKRSIAKDKKRHLNKAQKGEEGVGMSENEFKALEAKKAVISKEILALIPKGIVKKQVEVLDTKVGTVGVFSVTTDSKWAKMVIKYFNDDISRSERWIKRATIVDCLVNEHSLVVSGFNGRLSELQQRGQFLSDDSSSVETTKGLLFEKLQSGDIQVRYNK